MKNTLVDLFYQVEDYFFRSISKECLDFDEITTAYLTGVNDENINLLYIRENIKAIDKILNSCKKFYNIHHSPWSVIVSELFVSNELEHSLNNIGLSPSGRSVAMFLELNKQNKHDNTNDMTIHLINDRLEQWMTPLVSAFGSTIEITRQYAEAHERALINKANFYHFTLHKDGLSVSSLTLSWQSNIARIDDVGTLAAYQNKGYATQLMKHAIDAAINLGASYCFLEASESGLSVYQKLGFKPLFRNITYSKTRTN